MMNQVFTHPGQDQMQVEVILASRHADMPDEKPLYTIRMRYPRPIHGEVMTHRVFGRNARSSRAVPVKTMLNEVRTIPYVPWHWGANQKGMQASEECSELLTNLPWEGGGDCQWTREQAWIHASKISSDVAEAFMNAGYHKQNPNRLLEPFSWIDTLITANRWDNFLWLREHKDAEPHLQDLARLVHEAIDAAEIQELPSFEWHLPYITQVDYKYAAGVFGALTKSYWEWLRQISAARCARISYKPFDGDPSYERELERYNMLVTSERVHASPLEHQATPDSKIFVQKAFSESEQSEAFDFDSDFEWENPQHHGNLTGWIQNRKLVPNEVYNG